METQGGEQIPQEEKGKEDIRAYLRKNLINKRIADFFGLKMKEIESFINTVGFSRGSISPMFLSPGFGINDSNIPIILITPLSNKTTYLHEARHGLYYQKCCVIFKTPETCLRAFDLFCENVLEDVEFIKLIKKKGSSRQKEIIDKVQKLQQKQNISPEDISRLASELGALTYQHAYFVDPAMCEAAASYGDTGIIRIIGIINRTAASFIPIPNSVLKGYGNRELQSMFETANPFQKALLVKKGEYNRKEYFSNVVAEGLEPPTSPM